MPNFGLSGFCVTSLSPDVRFWSHHTRIPPEALRRCCRLGDICGASQLAGTSGEVGCELGPSHGQVTTVATSGVLTMLLKSRARFAIAPILLILVSSGCPRGGPRPSPDSPEDKRLSSLRWLEAHYSERRAVARARGDTSFELGLALLRRKLVSKRPEVFRCELYAYPTERGGWGLSYYWLETDYDMNI